MNLCSLFVDDLQAKQFTIQTYVQRKNIQPKSSTHHNGWLSPLSVTIEQMGFDSGYIQLVPRQPCLMVRLCGKVYTHWKQRHELDKKIKLV